MKISRTLSCAAVLSFIASTAIAGPMGSGLALTEEVAKRRPVTFQAPAKGDECLHQAAQVLRTRSDVHIARVSGDQLKVTPKAGPHQVAAIEGVVQDSCGPATRAAF